MKVKVKFREIAKEGLEIQVPPEIAGRIRARAATQRRSISEVGTEILSRGLAIDPAEFGIRADLTDVPSAD